MVGVRGENLRTGSSVERRAQGVILATGGFQSNLALVREFWPKSLPFPERLLIGSGVNSVGRRLTIAKEAGAAPDPETGTLFVPSVTIPNTVTIAQPESPASDMRYVTRPSRPRTEGPRDLPLVKPPYGRITTIDLNTGEHRWMGPHGTGPRDHPALEALKLPPLGWDSRGFVVATKTLLLAVEEPRVAVRLAERGAAFEYTAKTREARLRAFDKTTWPYAAGARRAGGGAFEHPRPIGVKEDSGTELLGAGAGGPTAKPRPWPTVPSNSFRN